MGINGTYSRRVKAKDKRPRVCLRCKKVFQSFGINNRLCRNCRDYAFRVESRIEPDYTISIGKHDE